LRTVSQVIEIAKDWVEDKALSAPGFYGAYLAGSVCRLEGKAPFPGHRDVDIYVLLRDSGRILTPKVKRSYKGILVDGEFHSLSAYRSPDAVLSSPEIAPNLAAGMILSDPTGLLSKLRSIVESEYMNRRWVQARCAWERQMVMDHLAQIKPGGTSIDMLGHMVWVVLGLAGLIAVANLEPPTVRRCLVLARELLQAQGRPELHEAILEAWGSAHLTRSDVESCLQACVAAFDVAVRVMRTPTYGVHPDVRSSLVEGAREMVDRGHHREATFWIVMMHNLSNRVVKRDAEGKDRARSQAGLRRVLEELGLGTAGERRARLQLVQWVTEQVFGAAKGAVARLPASASPGAAPPPPWAPGRPRCQTG
jgi:hypothetical protein